jgi:hypothetical protein
MPTNWVNDLPPAAQAPTQGLAPKPPGMQQPLMGQGQPRPRPMGRATGQQGPPGGGGAPGAGRWWQNPGSAVRPPVGAPPGAPPAPAQQPAAPPPAAPAAGAPPAPYNAGARFNQPPAAAPAPAPAAGAPPAPAPYNAGARFQQPAAPPPAAAPPAPAPAQGTSLQAAPSEGNASQAWAAAMQGAGRNFAGVDPDRARLDQMSRMDAARNPNASMYGNPGGMDRPDMRPEPGGDDRVYSTVQDRDPGMSGGGSSIRAWGPGEGGPDARNRMAQMMEQQDYNRRSRAFGPKPPAGVASYGVAPMGGGELADAAGSRGSEVDNERAAAEQQQEQADLPQPEAPAPEGSIDPGRAAMGLGRGLPPPRRSMMMQRRPMPMGRGRGPAFY